MFRRELGNTEENLGSEETIDFGNLAAPPKRPLSELVQENSEHLDQTLKGADGRTLLVYLEQVLGRKYDSHIKGMSAYWQKVAKEPRPGLVMNIKISIVQPDQIASRILSEMEERQPIRATDDKILVMPNSVKQEDANAGEWELESKYHLLIDHVT